VTQSTSVPAPARSAGRMSRRTKSAGPELYDFRRPAKLAREHVRTLQLAYETFARHYTTLLTSTLRAVSQVNLISIEQQSYEEYMSSLSSPTMMALVNLEPLAGTAILEFSMGTAMVAIDHMLGGSGGEQPERPLTDIEAPLLHGMLERVLGDFRYAFESIVTVRPQLVGIEYSPQFVQVAGASDPMIVASFEMRVGAEECVATLCLPFSGIFAKLQGDRNDVTLSDAQRSAREQARRNVVAGLESVPLEVAVQFQPITMRPKDLVDLRPGDVIPLSHAVTAPLAVTSAGLTFASAVPGSQGARLACLVVAQPTESAKDAQ
jgi:flagellar motor switch protein FliM